MPVIERAIETASLMLGSDRSRGYCLEMICADFLAGANLDHGDPEMLLFSMTRFFRFLPGDHKIKIPVIILTLARVNGLGGNQWRSPRSRLMDNFRVARHPLEMSRSAGD
jgi:hypothetical protein